MKEKRRKMKELRDKKFKVQYLEFNKVMRY